MDYEMSEKQFQEQIYRDEDIKKNIIGLISEGDVSYNDFTFVREVEFINGITSDFIVYDKSDKIRAIIECKRADIGVTEYVRGVGQLFQYKYFEKNGIKPKKHESLQYSMEVPTYNILMIPSTFMNNTNLNIGLFDYPKDCLIVEIHSTNKLARGITEIELKRIAQVDNNSVIALSQYYIRDNRIFEIYILFKTISIMQDFSDGKFDRKKIEKKLFENIKVVNNGNWRNAFISLSTLGLIDSENKVTYQASMFSKYRYCDFCALLYRDYITPFIDEIMEVLVENKNESDEVKLSNLEIANLLNKKKNGKKVLFLTDSDTRYISSWMNIMRDDYGCIDFSPRKSIRTIKYIPKELKHNVLISKIEENSTAQKYIIQYEKVKRNIVF